VTKRTSRKSALTRNLLLSFGIPTVFIPGLILASLLGWNWRQGLSILKAQGGYTNSKTIFPTQAIVSNVYDGDTIVLSTGQTIRLLGINAPDRGEKGYEAAKAYMEDILDGSSVELEYDTYQDDKYGRLLAYVFRSCNHALGCKQGRQMVNWLLIKKGYAEAIFYKDRAKLKYQDYLEKANGTY